MLWVGHVARMGQIETSYANKVKFDNLNGKDHVRCAGVNGRIILKCILKQCAGAE